MIDIFVYPVSGVMKLWHLLLHNALGINDSLAWLLSLIGLVVVVRALLVPAFWMLYCSSRRNAIMRPALARLNEEYAERTDPESVRELAIKTKQLRKDHGVSTAAGCIPALIQTPVFIGLYQVVLQMARPQGGLDSVTHPAIGFISSADVTAFINSRIGGIPLPAYRIMNETQLAALGTTQRAIADFILLPLILAMVFTFLNMCVSILRNRTTADYSSRMVRVMNRVILVMAVFLPFFLFNIGWNGPIPVAIVLYWVANNLWTVSQNLIINYRLNRILPYSQEVKDYSHYHRTLLKTQRQERRAALRAAGSREQRRELRATWKQEKAAEKEKQRRLAQERQASRRIIIAKRQAERQAHKAEKD